MRPSGWPGARPCDLRSTHRLLRGEWDPSRADHRLHNTRAGRSWSSPCRDRLGGVAGRFMSGLGSHLWWHVSVLSGGPGPWRCLRCDESDSDAWLDGHVVGAPVSCLAQPAKMRTQCHLNTESSRVVQFPKASSGISAPFCRSSPGGSGRSPPRDATRGYWGGKS
jgi:hypothetical protein